MRNTNYRGNSTSPLVLTAGKIRLFLTIELGSICLGVLFKTVVSVGDADEIILFVIDKRSVGTRGKKVS